MRFAAALSVLLFAGVAQAQSAEQEAREAFTKGLARESAGSHDEACKLFQQSLALTRELGPLAKVYACSEQAGRLLQARTELDELIARFPQPGPELEAHKKRRESIDRKIPRLSLKKRADAPAGLRVQLGAEELRLPLENRELDPGAYELLIDVPEAPLERRGLQLVEGDRLELVLPSERQIGDRKSIPETPKADAGPSGLLIGGILSSAVAGAALIGAAVTGGLVLSKKSEFDECSGNCADLADEGDTLLVANAVLWGAFGVAGALGVTLIVVDATSSVEVSPTSARVTLRF